MVSLHIDTARTWRGGQQQVLLTVLGLRARGHRAVLVAHPEGELRRRAAQGDDVIPLGARGEMDLGAGWKLARIIRDLRPEVVHAHDPHAVALAAFALALGANRRRPALVAARRVDFHLKRNAFSRWKYRQVDLFLCASNAIRAMIVANGVAPERALTVHEGIDVERVEHTPAVRVHSEFWLPTDAPIVGNVAALVPHKGQRYLIEAAALTLRHVPDARFLIVGTGPLEAALRTEIRRRGLERHVILAGFRPDAVALIKGFDLFVLSSITEGLGTSLLDAMACRRAIVASRTGGIPEVVVHEETGLLVPPRNGAALAESIVRLLQDPERRRQFGEAGYARVVAHFTADRMVEDTLRAYARVVRA
ncbi:MAG: glycosyltransferase [Armatimonadota bacterium]|nr:glycosyltransferase [Armatimonadota bacterium]